MKEGWVQSPVLQRRTENQNQEQSCIKLEDSSAGKMPTVQIRGAEFISATLHEGTGNPVFAGEGRQVVSQSLLASQSTQLVSPRLSEKCCLKTLQLKQTKENNKQRAI